jgi:uncharacterized membrane protein YqaE (UPF0057 family)
MKKRSREPEMRHSLHTSFASLRPAVRFCFQDGFRRKKGKLLRLFKFIGAAGVVMGVMFLSFAVVQYLNGGWSFLLSLLLCLVNFFMGINLLKRSGNANLPPR